jgi:FMN-dependent NADH-azoreductase
MKILHLDSSILGDASASRQLTRLAVDRLLQGDASTQVIHRDLGAQPVAHLTGEILATRGTAAEHLNDLQRREAQLDADLLRELEWADVLVIGAPIYNFTVPTGLKAWIDRVAVAGKTFRYTDKGPEGLVKGKKAILVATSGGIYTDSPVDGAYVGYLKALLGFLGITDIEVVRAEGLAISDQVRAHAMAKAKGRIRELGPAAIAA